MEINHATSEDGAVWECRIDNAKAYTEVAVRAQPLAILPPLQQPLLEDTISEFGCKANTNQTDIIASIGPSQQYMKEDTFLSSTRTDAYGVRYYNFTANYKRNGHWIKCMDKNSLVTQNDVSNVSTTTIYHTLPYSKLDISFQDASTQIDILFSPKILDSTQEYYVNYNETLDINKTFVANPLDIKHKVFT